MNGGFFPVPSLRSLTAERQQETGEHGALKQPTKRILCITAAALVAAGAQRQKQKKTIAPTTSVTISQTEHKTTSLRLPNSVLLL